ncbi:hypothetical protein [Akkermansia sp.]|uniref:hypothetical protein n=1 Tax=Akkermansia sp. TaxID=1872421 RepID=UPI0025C5AC28|nr:hypothetical protein [Akkermansia sp.]
MSLDVFEFLHGLKLGLCFSAGCSGRFCQSGTEKMMENPEKALEGNDLSCGERKARIIPVLLACVPACSLFSALGFLFYLPQRLPAFLQVLRGCGSFRQGLFSTAQVWVRFSGMNST